MDGIGLEIMRLVGVKFRDGIGLVRFRYDIGVRFRAYHLSLA